MISHKTSISYQFAYITWPMWPITISVPVKVHYKLEAWLIPINFLVSNNTEWNGLLPCFQLNDIESGGDTVFPVLGVRVPAVKVCTFFYNGGTDIEGKGVNIDGGNIEGSNIENMTI